MTVGLVPSEGLSGGFIPCFFPNFSWFAGIFGIPWFLLLAPASLLGFLMALPLWVYGCIQASPSHKGTVMLDCVPP